MSVKAMLGRLGAGLVRRFGRQVEQEALQRLERLESIAHVLIERSATKAKREVKKRVAKK